MVKPKKHLGQHFLIDQNIARKIVGSLTAANCNSVIEIGPGKGILTKFLIERPELKLKLIEIDPEAVEYLNITFPQFNGELISQDFLKSNIFTEKSCYNIIGNLPYNISSQIFFRVLEFRNYVPEMVVMIQKEVAERIASSHGNKTYGILSVLLQAFYKIEYLFTVNEKVFNPPPKVKSGVIRLTRNNTANLECNEEMFFKIVKLSFNHRRKTLRNSLKSILLNLPTEDKIFEKRPEQLSVAEFVKLTLLIEANSK